MSPNKENVVTLMKPILGTPRCPRFLASSRLTPTDRRDTCALIAVFSGAAATFYTDFRAGVRVSGLDRKERRQHPRSHPAAAGPRPGSLPSDRDRVPATMLYKGVRLGGMGMGIEWSSLRCLCLF